MVKILMSWNIKPGHEQDYFEFVVREWVPGLQGLGIEPTDAWYTMYGDENTPQIMAGGTAKNAKAMQAILASQEWHHLKEQLLLHVENYAQKVVKARSGFQIM